MNIEDWLIKQRDFYHNLPQQLPTLSVHPASGQWQPSNYMKSQFWWGGGACQETCKQIQSVNLAELSQVAVLSFGPVQTFLGGGQRLRDWAVGSWLCHYLSAVLIHKWKEYGGQVLLPLHDNSELVKWLGGSKNITQEFWQAELPNVITGLHPKVDGWLDRMQQVVNEEWGQFISELDRSASKYSPHLLNGRGWQVIRLDNQYLWSVYAETDDFDIAHATEIIGNLHDRLESRKVGREWRGTWWGGRTSPSAGSLSIWHPGLQPMEQKGTWGLPDAQIEDWWGRATEESRSRLSNLFSKDDRLNSIELVKRLASVPDIIEPTLMQLWNNRACDCPWGTFPDRTAVAATWVTVEPQVNPQAWNTKLQALENDYFSDLPKKSKWGMPVADRNGRFHHPRALERRNIDKDLVEIWDSEVPQGWESTIEWTVGWRGDGDNMGKWLSGDEYKELCFLWPQWHLSAELIAEQSLGISAPIVPEQARELDLPHTLDLSVLFSYWNRLLYPLTEEHHNSKVIFAGGDDFLLLGPLTEAVKLTTNLHHLWTGEKTALTKPLPSPADGWALYNSEVYPVPGKQMNFSLGVVIAQRRIPQSLWHRSLNQAYKKAKEKGKNRVCVQVIFNSGQSLEWVCPWPLWHLLMSIEPTLPGKTKLNRWEKLLFYLESTRLQEYSITAVQELIEMLWQSVGIDLSWQDVLSRGGRQFIKEIEDWQWWINWISLKAFLTRQEREREKWIEGIIREIIPNL